MTLYQGVFDYDTISGGDGDDDLEGGEGNDTLYGGNNGDRIHGGDGDDVIYGGKDVDELWGDAGKDTFVYDNINNRHDYIYDFQVGDTNNANTGTYNADADVLDLAALLSYNQGDVINDFISFNDDDTNTILYIDADGDGSGFTDVSIELENVTGVTLQDMIADGNIVLF